VLAVGGPGRGIEAEELLAGEERVARRDVDRASDADVDAVERALVAHDELAVAVEEVRVLGRDERVVGEDELPVAADDVLLRLQMEREPIHPLTADEDELRLRGVLHVPEEERLCVEDLDRDGGAAPPAELVPGGHPARAGTADVIAGLLHELLLRE